MWQINFPTRSIQQIDILPGKPPLLAVWTRRDHVVYYDLRDGEPQGEQIIKPAGKADRRSEMWQTFLSTLKAPNGSCLPLVDLSGSDHFSIYSSEDGRLRLYHTGGADLYLELENAELKLDQGQAETFTAIGLDRLLGMIAALDSQGQFHLFQQDIGIGEFDLGLKPQPELQPGLVVASGSGLIFASNGQRIVLTNPAGQIEKSIDLHYFAGLIACSPDGNLLAVSDLEAGVIRTYSGIDLLPLHQRFAADLLESAQLETDSPLTLPEGLAVSALSINNQGILAFAMGSYACVTDTEHMDAFPRQRKLF